MERIFLVLGGDGLDLGEAVLGVHVLEGIEDGALGAILVGDLGIDRPLVDQLVGEASLDEEGTEGVLLEVSLEPVEALGQAFERRGGGVDTVVTGVRLGIEAKLLPLVEQSSAEGALRTFRRVGGSEDLATEVLPGEGGGIELDAVPVDVGGVLGELVAHGHEETVENVLLDAGVVELGAVESAAEFLDETGLLHLEVLGVEFIRGPVAVGGVAHGVVGAAFLEDLGPVLRELGGEFLDRDVQLRGLLQGGLGGDGVVVLVDELALVDFLTGIVTLSEDFDTLGGEGLLDQLLDIILVGVGLDEHERGVLRLLVQFDTHLCIVLFI